MLLSDFAFKFKLRRCTLFTFPDERAITVKVGW
jgi:hypothetical protein